MDDIFENISGAETYLKQKWVHAYPKSISDWLIHVASAKFWNHFADSIFSLDIPSITLHLSVFRYVYESESERES